MERFTDELKELGVELAVTAQIEEALRSRRSKCVRVWISNWWASGEQPILASMDGAHAKARDETGGD
jgi:hypothetical protein